MFGLNPRICCKGREAGRDGLRAGQQHVGSEFTGERSLCRLEVARYGLYLLCEYEKFCSGHSLHDALMKVSLSTQGITRYHKGWERHNPTVEIRGSPLSWFFGNKRKKFSKKKIINR